MLSDYNGYKSKIKRNSNLVDYFDYEFTEDNRGNQLISFKAIISDVILKSYLKRFPN